MSEVNELGNTLPNFIQAYKKIVQNGIGIDKVIRIAEIHDEILILKISIKRNQGLSKE
jgi:hypothetical protein